MNLTARVNPSSRRLGCAAMPASRRTASFVYHMRGTLRVHLSSPVSICHAYGTPVAPQRDSSPIVVAYAEAHSAGQTTGLDLYAGRYWGGLTKRQILYVKGREGWAAALSPVPDGCRPQRACE